MTETRLEPLNWLTKAEIFIQTDQIIELCFENLSA